MQVSLETLVDWCHTHGIVMGMKSSEHDSLAFYSKVTHAPVSVSPYAFPKSVYYFASTLSEIFNSLICYVSKDYDWLHETLLHTAANDTFTQRLLQIFEVTRENQTQISLIINRSDYMLHQRPNDPRELLQVEINTISASFASLSTKISEMHQKFYATNLKENEELPDNQAIDEMACAIATAHREYVKSVSNRPHSSNIAMLMIVQEKEKNFADQKHLQYHLLEKYGVVSLRYTLLELATLAELAATGALLVKHPKDASEFTTEISVVYFRGGYGPEDYGEEACWEARLKVEQSLAVKCPSIAHQLVGTKKVQQALALPGVLERFITDPNQSALLRKVFAGLYGLDEVDGEATVQMALASPEDFVLKPQREGGGHNFYGPDVARLLRALSTEERQAFILMEKIRPPVQPAILVREGVASQVSCLCELGIYGVYVRNGEEVLINKMAGHLLRVKPADVDEGGVGAGYAVLSSPLLF